MSDVETMVWNTVFPSGHAKYVAAALARQAWKTGRVFPSLATITNQVQLSKSSVIRALAELEAGGFVRREKRKRPNGSQTSTEYYLTLKPVLVAMQSPEPDGWCQDDTAPCVTETQPPCQGDTPRKPELKPEGTNVPLVRGARVARSAPKATPTRRCPAKWVMSDAVRVVGEGLGLTPEEIDFHEAQMRDTEFPKPRSDWDAVMRKWLRSEAKKRTTSNERADRYDPIARRQRQLDGMFRGAQDAIDARRRDTFDF